MMARGMRGKGHPAAIAALAVVLPGALLVSRNELPYSCSEVRVGGTTLVRTCTNRLTGTQ
jgi:hypothetical protein